MQLPKFHPLRLKFQLHRFKLAQKSKLTWFAKNPGRVAAGKILEEYNRLCTTVKVISVKLTHPCVIALSSPCILLLRLICALFKENQRESRLREDLALSLSNTHIHHFPITFVLNSCFVIEKAVIFLKSIIVWPPCMKQRYDYEYEYDSLMK